MTQKLKKKLTFLLVSLSFLHIESSVIPPLKAFMKGFISSCTLKSYEQYMRTLWPKSMKIWWFNRALCSLIHQSVLGDIFLKPWTDQHVLTFKVNVILLLPLISLCFHSSIIWAMISSKVFLETTPTNIAKHWHSAERILAMIQRYVIVTTCNVI